MTQAADVANQTDIGGFGFDNLKICTGLFKYRSPRTIRRIYATNSPRSKRSSACRARGISIEPPGDVIAVDVLNRGADGVLKLVRASSEKHEIFVTTYEVASFIDPKKSAALI